jgi:hypothetical protein
MADAISEPTIVPISPAVAEAMNEGVHKDEEARSARAEDPTTDQSPGSAVNRDAQAIPAVPRQSELSPRPVSSHSRCEIFGSAARMVAGFP